MRINSYLIFGIMLSGSLLAQQPPTTPPPAAEAPAAAPVDTNATAAPVVPAQEVVITNAAPAKKKAAPKKKSPKKSVANKKQPGSDLKTEPLVPGPAAVVATHVNVRGQAKLSSEVVGRLAKDQVVTVLEEITHKHSGPDEPSAWAKIALPTDVHVWINNSFIDPSTKTVKPKKLNVRSGPGENFSVLGRLERGDTVNQAGAKGDWLEIEAPTNAYAFVAAQYLKQPPPTPVAAPATTTVAAETPPAAATVTNEPTLAAAATGTPPTASPPATPDTTAPTVTPPEPTPTTPEPAPPASEEPPPKRVVEREGFVRGTSSIQAPTKFELISMENKRTIDYLYTTTTNLDLSRYKGLHIVVTGEEGLEERRGNTPVITIEKIQVVE